MKTKMLSLLLALFVSGALFAQQAKNEKFKVYGNCGLCENRIETAAKGVDGVTNAEWNKQTKMMEVKFDASKTDIKKIEKAIADAGHDTPMFKASEESYDALPGCCKYTREKED